MKSKLNVPVVPNRKPNPIVGCADCGKLLLNGQTCVCGRKN